MLEVSRLEVSVGSSAGVVLSCERAVAAQSLLVGMARMAVRAPNTKTVKFVALWYGFPPNLGHCPVFWLPPVVVVFILFCLLFMWPCSTWA